MKKSENLKKVWEKPNVTALSVKNSTFGSKPSGIESNLNANNGRTAS